MICRSSSANGLFIRRLISKTILERTANQHIKDKTNTTIKINLLTVMQVFSNATVFSPETSSGSKTVKRIAHQHTVGDY